MNASASLHDVNQEQAKAKAATAAALAANRDHEDQLWLTQQVGDLALGFDAAREIDANWTKGRNVGRLHPDMTLADYINSLDLRLTLPEAMVLLPSGSTREIAKVAGVSKDTVQRARVAFETPDAEPARTTGADGKSYPGRVVREVAVEVIEPPVRAPAALHPHAAKMLRMYATPDDESRPLTPAADRPEPLRKARPIPGWSRQFSSWCRGARPEDRDFLRRIDREIHAALDRNSIACEREDAGIPRGHEQFIFAEQASKAKDVTPASDALPPCPVVPTFGAVPS